VAHSRLDHEIESMIRNPRIAGVVKESPARLGNGHAGPEMAEMARGVMDGSIRLRDVARSSVYSEGFLAGFERYKRWEAEQDPVELRRMVEQTRVAMGDDRLGD
jgi:hypothetical protein